MMRKLDGRDHSGAKDFLDLANKLKADQEKKNSKGSKFSISFAYSKAPNGGSVDQAQSGTGSKAGVVGVEATVTCGCFSFLCS